MGRGRTWSDPLQRGTLPSEAGGDRGRRGRGGFRFRIDLGPLPSVDQRAGSQPVRLVGPRRPVTRNLRPESRRWGHLSHCSHASRDQRPCGCHHGMSTRRPGSLGESGPAKPSTNTFSEIRGHQPTSASRCSRKLSRSSAACGGESFTHAAVTTPSRTPRIFDVPEELPPIVVSAFGDEAVELASGLVMGFGSPAWSKM